ncbi:immunomodulatory protein FIP-Fve [Dichomitus squalens]|uniref:Immunomodulatory protein FIP-Fve n=1 Tax=Dichomitus squalens TaxID=114155 RepID=A0A4Q9MRR5_9APHY|nr:immunomodulatory protein FIP-Fve [Dichomitus squalens]
MSAHVNNTAITFALVWAEKKLTFDYTPNWVRGHPSSYVDNVVFPKVLTDKKYSYRVLVSGKDLGVRDGYSVQSDGSQKVNFLEYNAGRGIADSNTIQVYAVDPDDGNNYLVAQFN